MQLHDLQFFDVVPSREETSFSTTLCLQLASLAPRLLSDRHLSNCWFPDCTNPDHNNIPDHCLDVYIYPDLQLSRPVHKKDYIIPCHFSEIINSVFELTVGIWIIGLSGNQIDCQFPEFQPQLLFNYWWGNGWVAEHYKSVLLTSNKCSYYTIGPA